MNVPRPKPRVLLGVTGSVAAYKSLELVRALRTFAEVRVVLTEAGSRLVPSRELSKASGHPVWSGLFKGAQSVPPGTPSGSHPRVFVPHIEYAKSADLVLIAPATADILAKLAFGLGDDLLSTLCLYAPCPLWVAPAMNARMWGHPAVRENHRVLASRGVRFLGPDSGHLACGEVGDGRFAEPSEIALQVRSHLEGRGRWRGWKVLVTAGPTREPLDPVRYLTNRSSGKMGYALAQAALDRGAQVVLVSGPTALQPPRGAKFLPVETAVQMRRKVLDELKGTDLAVLAAAVADYAPRLFSPSKIKKGKGQAALPLRKNPDILGEVLARGKGRPAVLAFAAETGDLRGNALRKWKKKPAEVLAANLVGGGKGFDSDHNRFLVFRKGWAKPLPLGPDTKSALAQGLMDLVEPYFVGNPEGKVGR